MPEEKKFSSLKEYVNNRVKTIIDSYLEKGKSWVFVLVGLTDIMDADSWKHQIDDYDTFLRNGNEKLFDKIWFKKVFLQLSDDDKDYHILSYPQYTYLPKDIFQRFFGNEKVVFIRDNLRQLFLMDQSNYIEKSGIEDEERPDDMPLYQAEQVKLDENYYYTLVTPLEGYLIEDVFDGELKVDFLESESEDIRLLDVNSDKYSLDIFINECFQSNDLSKEVVIKYFPKQPNNSIRDLVLRKLNFLLNLFGGRILLKKEAAISAAEIRPEIITLLKKYWDDGAEFRDLKVYKNPTIDKEIIKISQGKLVQDIIDEYENAKRGIEPRDLFLTAPTGAGKSLLFQLPAFYISNNGDVTIVVSPLIALMKDQVKGIIEERHFEKVACINGELNVHERNKLIEDVKAGLIDVVYLSPELLLSYDLSFFIGERNLGLLVIDEAHLITTWGRDFRVDYWYLGNYIRQSRKYREGKFPMVAVTATAVYGGVNDMVFDGIDSLYMQNPRIYIGQVKRDDIEFVINNYESVKKGYKKFKMQQTIDFIKEAVDCKIKTIVYCPYTSHVDSLMNNYMPAQILDYVGAYHAQLDSNRKEYAYKMFKAGKKHVMLCTKAFGMGVDIKDIQVVYHHAPSGMLPDYVQEIGRVARKEGLQGYAMLDYSPDDQNYSKSLHGMSSIRQWQLKEMLKKIHALYVKNGKKRKLLVSVDDFAHIFERELDQKVFTSLTMLEKDYLERRLNVLIARPRKLLATVYAKVSDEDLRLLKVKYSTMLNYTQRKDVVELNLAKLWEKHFSDISFPLMKASFYNGSLFNKDGITISPQVIVSYTIKMPYEAVYSSLSSLFDMLKFAFSIMMSQHKFFSQDAFKEELAKELNEKKAERIAEFVLSTYSETPFLLRRPTQEGKYNDTYQVRGNGYIRKFDDLLKRFHQLFGSTKEMTVSDFITKKDNKKDANKDEILIDYIRLGCFLELLDFGTYEMKGGKNPVIFIRLVDPERIEKDARNENYENQLLRKTTRKFDDSNRLFDYFFCRKFSNEERWNFIEDFFLGANNDDLEKKYIGENVPNKRDLLQYLKSIEPVVTENGGEDVPNDENDIDVVMDHFLPKAGSWYSQDSMLTIETPNGKITRKISEWLSKDPILLDKTRIQYDLRFGKEELKILNSKVNNQDKGYYTETRGLMVSIEFKGYPGRVRASIPYKDKPLEFYKWWCKNEDKVHLSTAEQIQLFFKVKVLKPNALLKKHEKMISK